MPSLLILLLMVMNPVEGLMLNKLGAWSSPIIEKVTTLNGDWKRQNQIQPCTKTSRQIRRNNSVCYFHIHVFKNLQTYKVVSICGGDRDDGSTATNRRGDGPRVGLVLEGGWELITPYIDGHRNGCTLQLGNTIIPSKCIILYKRKKILVLLHK